MPKVDEFNNRSELVETLSMVIFTCSVQHAAVNFPQYNSTSYVPGSILNTRLGQYEDGLKQALNTFQGDLDDIGHEIQHRKTTPYSHTALLPSGIQRTSIASNSPSVMSGCPGPECRTSVQARSCFHSDQEATSALERSITLWAVPGVPTRC